MVGNLGLARNEISVLRLDEISNVENESFETMARLPWTINKNPCERPVLRRERRSLDLLRHFNKSSMIIMEKRWLANRRSDVVVALVRLIHLDHGIWKRRRRRRQGGGSVFYSQIFPGIVFLLITSLSNDLYLANLINRTQLLIFYRRFHIYPIIVDAIHLRHNCDFSLTTSLSTSHLETFHHLAFAWSKTI